MKRTWSLHSVADQLAVLADATRLRLLRVLETHELSVGELAKVLQSPQSTVSRHLKTLADAGWLVRRSDGPAMFYRVVLDELEPRSRGLWLAIRERSTGDRSGLGSEGESGEAAEDERRVAAVLAERRTDSQAFFGRVAGEWDAVRDQLFGTRFMTLALLSLLPSEWVVADLGCGTGNVSEVLAPVVKRVIAIDQSGPMLDAAAQRLAGVKNVDFVRGGLEALPLKDGGGVEAGVDAAIFGLVLHHIEAWEKPMAEAARILKPGGVCVVVDMVRHERAEYRHQMGHKHLGFTAKEVRGMLASAGLEPMHYRELPTEPDAKGPGLFVAVGRKKGRGDRAMT